MLGLATKPKGTIDAVGLPALGKALSKKGPRTSEEGNLPRVVMLSSAGVTRPGWSEEKKAALEGSAGIPIVRLNPFGILGVKEESEDELRKCGEFLCVLVPDWSAIQFGLWPTRLRPKIQPIQFGSKRYLTII